MNGTALPWLPHGPEFRFVDEVLEYSSGKSVVGCLDLGANSPRLPYAGTLPAFYLLESMIQTCGLLCAEPETDSDVPPLAVVVALDKVRWIRAPVEREKIITRGSLKHRIGLFLLCQCSAHSEDGTLLASGEVTLRIGHDRSPEQE
ncbi:MAG: hypothetical protein O7F16_09690 [Acidobacteria bacterium]|nr:hypothetical protein [Acidobacteriota bacterium]